MRHVFYILALLLTSHFSYAADLGTSDRAETVIGAGSILFEAPPQCDPDTEKTVWENEIWICVADGYVAPGWKSSVWGACTTSSKQSRSVTCVQANGTTIGDQYCAGTKPTTSQSCAYVPAYTYSWSYGGWSACSSSRTQSRVASCKRSDGVTVSGSFCGSATTSRGCTPSYSYRFIYSGWTGCMRVSNSCITQGTQCLGTGGNVYGRPGGTGLKNGPTLKLRSAVCRRSDGRNVSSGYCGRATLSTSCTLRSGLGGGSKSKSRGGL